MLPDEVRKAVAVVESHADDLMRCIGVLHAFKEMLPVEVEFSKAVDELKASTQTIRAHLLAREAEVERLKDRVEREESDCLEVIKERDWAQDCLQKAHVALGGDGEWTCKMPSPEPPDSGDLHYDVPVLAEEVRARAERAEALLREIKEWDVGSLQDRKTLFALPLAIRQRITAHLSENSRG